MGVEEAVTPYHGKEKHQEIQIESSCQSEDSEEKNHDAGSLSEKSKVHFSGSRKQREDKSPESAFFTCHNQIPPM